jgi:hypothetical protein
LSGNAIAVELSPQLFYYVPRDYVDTLSMNKIVRPERAMVAEIGTPCDAIYLFHRPPKDILSR